MLEIPTVWCENSPDTLLDICLRYCVNNPLIFCTYELSNLDYKLQDELSLPEEICEQMLALCKTELSKEFSNRFICLFKDPTRTRLRRVDLSGTRLDDEGLEIITRHSIIDLNISRCKKLTRRSVNYISRLKKTLHSLIIGKSVQLFNADTSVRLQNSGDHLSNHHMGLFQVSKDEQMDIDDLPSKCTLEFPRLQRLVINSLHKAKEYVCFNQLLNGTRVLTHLDLSSCHDIGDLNCLLLQKHLKSLILNDVPDVQQCLPAVCQLKSLRHLDLSHTGERHVTYEHPNRTLKMIVESLENLVSLDISGTNLAGARAQERDSPKDDVSSDDGVVLTDIPGLKSRVNRPLEFLGLLNTAHEACYRHHIPSKRITGDANEEQILTAGLAYCTKESMIQNVLNDLFHVFRFSTCSNIRLALDIVMEAMRLHLDARQIQVSGSASLFYIVKEEKWEFNIKIKRKIIKTLLDAMFAHNTDIAMLRNGCLTIINFKIPEDVLFAYERLVSLLLIIVSQDEQDDFVQRISIHLLNTLACQVEGIHKKLIGDLGSISIMLEIIEKRLNRNHCDEVMETAWSTMWNVTDETPENCARFLEGRGLDLFLGCLKAFPQRPELLRNMMGLLGNVAEVKQLRPNLMKDEYLSVFSELLSSKSDGIEVSYNAAGILSHIASDGTQLWVQHNISVVKRSEVLQRMVKAIEEWELETDRNINYRSFEPILRLLSVDHTPEAQYWAVWALANLTKVYPTKYCSLLKEEGGIEMLKELCSKTSFGKINELADVIMNQCEKHNDLAKGDEQHNTEEMSAPL